MKIFQYAKRGHRRGVYDLLISGVDVNVVYHHQKGLMVAIEKRDVEMARMLLKLGAQIEVPHSLVDNALVSECVEMVDLLLGYKPDVRKTLWHPDVMRFFRNPEILHKMMLYGAGFSENGSVMSFFAKDKDIFLKLLNYQQYQKLISFFKNKGRS